MATSHRLTPTAAIKSDVSSASPHQLRALAATLAVVAIVLLGRPATASSHPSLSVFFTPGRTATCTFHGYRVAFGDTPSLVCDGWQWQQRVRVTVTLSARGKPRLLRRNPYSVSLGEGSFYIPPGTVRGPRWRFGFGEEWWGNEGGEEGTRGSRGRVLFRCNSRYSGLTCRSSSGHGFWLGRTHGYRVF